MKKNKQKNNNDRKGERPADHAGGHHKFLHITAVIAILALSTAISSLNASAVSLSDNLPPVDPTKDTFKITVCDGPRLPTAEMTAAESTKLKRTYVPCDFNGAMLQIRHFIDIAMVAGVLVAIIGFTYAGVLYISGVPEKMGRARSILPKIFLGFVIMLSSWFVVFQILSWLTSDPAYKALLGSP